MALPWGIQFFNRVAGFILVCLFSEDARDAHYFEDAQGAHILEDAQRAHLKGSLYWNPATHICCVFKLFAPNFW